MQFRRSKLHRKPGASILVLILHGYAGKPAYLDGIRTEIIDSALPNADVFIPSLPFRFFGSTRPLEKVVWQLADKIDVLWRDRLAAGQGDSGYRHIILAGHSCSSQLVRGLALHAYGYDQERKGGTTNLGRSKRPWAGAIDRVVMIAGVNRGWTDDCPMSPWLRIAQPFAHLASMLWPGRVSLLDVARGAPFLTTLRLRWLAMQHDLKGTGQLPTMIQLLGTRDDLTGPNDNIDFVTGSDFYYLEVAGAGHFDIINVQPHVDVAGTRRAALTLALTGTEPELALKAVPHRELSVDLHGQHPDPTVDDVVFIIHGIRDYGYWTHRLGVAIRRRAGNDRILIVDNPSYGFFPILPFLFPALRRSKVEWFMDRYVEVRALYPKARLSAVGHSNGTFLLAKAIELCPLIAFDRVVFAGSVVRRNYPWAEVIGSRINRAVNIVASDDMVVAFFPKGLQPLGVFEVGSAGHDGFPSEPLKYNPVSQIRYVDGGHSESIREDKWDAIAELIIGDPDQSSLTKAFGAIGHRTAKAVWLGRLSTFLVLAAALLIAGCGVLLTGAIADDNFLPAVWLKQSLRLSDDHNRPWYLMIAYLWIVRIVLSRF